MKKTLLITALTGLFLGAAIAPCTAAPISAPPQISEADAQSAQGASGGSSGASAQSMGSGAGSTARAGQSAQARTSQAQGARASSNVGSSRAQGSSGANTRSAQSANAQSFGSGGGYYGGGAPMSPHGAYNAKALGNASKAMGRVSDRNLQRAMYRDMQAFSRAPDSYHGGYYIGSVARSTVTAAQKTAHYSAVAGKALWGLTKGLRNSNAPQNASHNNKTQP